MFFDEEILALRKRAVLRDPPPIPETGWRPPKEFPNLEQAVVLSLDTETKENDWDHGPGWGKGKSHIVGFSIGAQDRLGNIGQWYFPIRHEVHPHDNLDPKQCLAWAKFVLETPVPKIGASMIYDVGNLASEGIDVKGEIHDIQFAEALIDETAKTALEALANKYVGGTKETDLLYEWCKQAYGGKVGGDQRANIFRSPPSLVGPYGEADASLPLRVFEKQRHILYREGTYPIYRMECGLIRLLIRMRLRGVRISVPYCERLYSDLSNDIRTAEGKLKELVGFHVEVASPKSMARAFDSVGIEYPLTAAGNPSFQKEFMKAMLHPVGDAVNDVRELYKVRDTFVQSYLLEGNVNGRIHGSFHPLRGDDGGTITGRFSSSNPNLQNIPVRSKAGKKVRKAFIPDEGHECWRKSDYSQIEYRMLAHFASGNTPVEIASIETLLGAYNSNPKTDYHDQVYDNVGPLLGYDLADKELRKDKRRPIKNINFGLLYGQSQKALAYKAGLGTKESTLFFKAYHEGAPYVKSTMKAIALEVQLNGYVTTILGRRVHFNLWEPSDFDRKGTALPFTMAVQAYGSRIKRAGDYKGVNYKLQGSAADVIKASMEQADRDGVFAIIGDPKLQVHDELDFSQIDKSPQQLEAYDHLQHIMETTVPARVPITIDTKTGATWGEID